MMKTVPVQSIMRTLERTGRVQAASLVKRRTIDIHYPELNRVDKITKVDEEGNPIEDKNEHLDPNTNYYDVEDEDGTFLTRHAAKQAVFKPSQKRLEIYDRQIEAKERKAKDAQRRRRMTQLSHLGFDPTLQRRRVKVRSMLRDEHTRNPYKNFDWTKPVRRPRKVPDSQFAPRPATSSSIFHQGVPHLKIVRPKAHQERFNALAKQVSLELARMTLISFPPYHCTVNADFCIETWTEWKRAR